MTGTVSSSSNRSGFSGSSNALSHVYIQSPSLRCQTPGSRRFFYDDGNKLLLAVTSDRVFSWKTTPYNPAISPSSDPISEGPVLSIRFSLDLELLAIQRSIHEVHIWNKNTGETFSHKCRSLSENILGFFWTDNPACDIVFVKTSGLELYSYNSASKFLHLVETKRQNISWYIYTHESRLVLLASGMQCKSFTGYQLSSAGTIRLPQFEMAMAKSEPNNKPVLAAEDVHMITLYGRIYCLQFDRVAMLLHSYRFYRDAVVQQGSLPVYSNRISVSVIDNVLLVHQVDAKVVIIYDMFSDSQAPISAPLPLLLRPNVASSQSTFKTDESEVVTIYGEDWKFLVPDLVCDVSNGFLWKIHMDLEAISASSSEVPLILKFLQRRNLEANKAKHLCLGIIRTIILERHPVPMVVRAIDVLLTTYSHAIISGSYYMRTKAEEETSPSGVSNTTNSSSLNALVDDSINKEPEISTENQSYSPTDTSIGYCDASGGAVGQIPGPDNDNLRSNSSSAAISPADLYSFVFARVEEEMAGEGAYLVSIMVEFIRSAILEKLNVHPSTYVLIVQILARDEQYAELGLFIINKIVEPSKEVALQLLESGRQNFALRKLGLGMLRQLSLHHDYVLILVQEGYYLEALRYARKNKVNTVRPILFLEAAYAANDVQHLAAVLRFFSDFIPGFKNTADHQTYHRIVANMNSSGST